MEAEQGNYTKCQTPELLRKPNIVEMTLKAVYNLHNDPFTKLTLTSDSVNDEGKTRRHTQIKGYVSDIG